MQKINRLVEDIINKFADEGMSKNEAMIVLNRVEGVLDEFSIVQHATDSEKEIEKIIDDFIKH